VKGKKKIIIAIDGYSSCGKSTLAKALARTLGYSYIDSGAMYRAVTLFLLEQGVAMDALTALPEETLDRLLAGAHILFRVDTPDGLSEIYLNGRNVEQEIRTLRVSDAVSRVSALPQVRKRMVELQQSYGREKGIVMDGRDIGTTVFPGAELKIFMTADTEIRAQRRYRELVAKGMAVTAEEVKRNIAERDAIDTTRKESPLRKAEDAVVLDNTYLTEQQQLDFAVQELERHGAA
jgi:cytidylate kinase